MDARDRTPLVLTRDTTPAMGRKRWHFNDVPRPAEREKLGKRASRGLSDDRHTFVARCDIMTRTQRRHAFCRTAGTPCCCRDADTV